MKKFFSTTAMVCALLTESIASSSDTINEVVSNTDNADVIKFIAPIIAGLLGKLIDNLFKRKQKGGQDA